jgi:hypothetical protein
MNLPWRVTTLAEWITPIPAADSHVTVTRSYSLPVVEDAAVADGLQGLVKILPRPHVTLQGVPQTLSRLERAVLVYFFVERLTLGSIGRALGLSPRAVARCLLQIRHRLSPTVEEVQE